MDITIIGIKLPLDIWIQLFALGYVILILCTVVMMFNIMSISYKLKDIIQAMSPVNNKSEKTEDKDDIDNNI